MKKNVMITGASRGLGRAFATGLAAGFSRFVLTARQTSHLEDIQAEIMRLGRDREVVTAGGDLSTADGVAAMLAGIGKDILSSVDVLISDEGACVTGQNIAVAGGGVRSLWGEKIGAEIGAEIGARQKNPRDCFAPDGRSQ